MSSQFYSKMVDTRETARILLEIAEKAILDPDLHIQARLITSQVESTDRSKILAVLSWVRRFVRFQSDPYEVELVFSPKRMIELIKKYGYFAEDCDSISCLTYALLKSLGLRTRFACAIFSAENSKLDHVFCQVLLDSNWLAVDPSLPPRMVGVMLSEISKLEIYEV